MYATTSPLQDGVWLQHRMDPGSPAYQVGWAYRLTGALDLAALRAAWRAVVHRHEILRTTLVERDGRAVQLITPPGGVRLSIEDVQEPPETWCARRVWEPVCLADGPPATLSVARLGPAEHVLLLSGHRGALDDRSAAIVLDELSRYCAGRPPAGPPPAQYAEYARWQRGLAGTRRWRDLVDWWTAALSPAVPPLVLPADRARPAGPSWPGGEVRFDWDERMGRALAGLAAAAGAAPRLVLVAAFLALLRRWGGGDRVAVAVPVPLRPEAAFAGLVGPCANPLVLCVDLSGGPTFRELLNRVTRAARAAADHHELPFPDLVRALNPDRDPRRVPFCDAMVVLRDDPEPSLRLPGAVVRPLLLPAGAVAADLTLTVDRAGPAVRGALAYRASLFDQASARRLVEQLRTLLAAALAEPGTPVDALPLEEPDRLRAAVLAADQVAVGVPRLSAPALVHRWVARRPDAPAVDGGAEVLTYRQLAARAAAVTRALRAGGEVAGAPVAVRMPVGPRQAATLLGVLDAGAHLVCLGPGDVGERGRAVLADLRPACLLLDRAPDGDRLAAWYRDELAGRVLDVTTLPDHDGEPPDPPPALADRAYVAYTSGSTGQPKGIPQSHATLAQFVTWLGTEFRIGPGSRVAQWAAPGYDASLCEAFAALVAGATLYPVADRIRAHPEKLLEWLATERITLFQTVPSVARELLAVLVRQGGAERLAALDHLLLAGEALPAELAEGLRAALPWVRLINLYGPTESILATWHDVTGHPGGGPAGVPIGRSIPGRQVLVLDDQDRPCPAGVTGQLVVRGPYVTPGYLGAAAEQTAPFRSLPDLPGYGIPAGPCYRTGDLGRRRFDGLLEFRGRRDLQVKLHGTRLELTDVEAALAGQETVSECVVVAVPGPDRMVARLAAYVVPRPAPDGTMPGVATWRSALRRRFGRAMPPVSFTTMDALPRNLGGKVDRRALPDPDPVSAADPPETPVEHRVAGIWAELLGAAPAGADQSFFSAGGHSLLVPRLLARIREAFGVDVPLWHFFADPTVRGLAALVGSSLVTEVAA
ncbi:non-ribosomal peptide synthetase [Micromonospora sp. ZYX-F-536]|uniref:non-ribosomal peptide synthetase n=1 Tax=Micromonospora sp. ZYX-F-536 TaxID=3457629 RepID=UPI004040BFC0